MTTPISSTVIFGEDIFEASRSDTVGGCRLMFEWNLEPLRDLAKTVMKQYQPADTAPFATIEASEERSLDQRPVTSGWWRKHDLIAWYVPAHNRMIEDYGIHFDGSKLRRMALDLEKHAPHGAIPELDWLVAAIEVCFWHEVCHGWIEDLSSLVEVITGKDCYTSTQTDYGSTYIFLEEAICNTAATGMTKMFFQSYGEKEMILAAIGEYMNLQPPGYCDYRVLPWYSARDPVLHEMTDSLLRDVYLAPSEALLCALRLFFDLSDYISPAPTKISLRRELALYFHLAAYPLFLEAYP